MIVAQILNAGAGVKIKDPATVFCEELGSFTARVARVHFENIQQARPSRVDAFLVQRVFNQSAAGS
jgi:hypothetical protein